MAIEDILKQKSDEEILEVMLNSERKPEGYWYKILKQFGKEYIYDRYINITYGLDN